MLYPYVLLWCCTLAPDTNKIQANSWKHTTNIGLYAKNSLSQLLYSFILWKFHNWIQPQNPSAVILRDEDKTIISQRCLFHHVVKEK